MVGKISLMLVACALSLGTAACAAATDETVVATATVSGIVTTLAPLAPGGPDASGETPALTAGASSSAIEDGGQIAPGGSIDLRELTPPSDSPGDGDFVELPAPGAPDPLARSVQLAREDLSLRLSPRLSPRLQTGEIEETALVNAEEVVWSDRSLGCPRPNTGYIAEETPGFKITLAAGGESFTYHTDLGQNVILCLDGEPAPFWEG
jgi:hypothetical protein